MSSLVGGPSMVGGLPPKKNPALHYTGPALYIASLYLSPKLWFLKPVSYRNFTRDKISFKSRAFC